MGKLLILVVGLVLGLLLARYLRGQRAGRDLTAAPPRPMVRVGDERIDNDEIRALIRQDRKIDAIAGAGVDAVVSGDASCLMQIEGRLRRRGVAVRVVHVAELLGGALAPQGTA